MAGPVAMIRLPRYHLTVFLAVCFAAVMGFLSAGRAYGEIRWEKQTVSLTSPSGEKLVRAEFRFTNVGRQPVTLLSIEPNCGCVSTSLTQMTYAPGEGGAIKVTFDLSMDGLAGLQERTIVVTTDDHAPRTVLRLEVTATTLAEAEPSRLSWKTGENPVTKVALVTASGPAAISVSQPFRASRDFNVVISPEAGSRRYRVAITPKTTRAPSFAQIHLVVSGIAAAEPEEVMLYAEVN
jgi:hypothetical protein